jgi:pimeloyl-ACP methyl ester carboxylesterase
MAFGQQFLEIGGCRINLRRGGAGAPLLYLHGASGAPAIMPFMEKLAASFDVLVPEHPGFGLSDEPEWLENIHDLAYFYLDVLDRLDLRDVLVVGSSIGGWLALEMAVRSIARLRALVLVAPAGIAVPGVQPADIFLWSPEELVRNLFHDQKLAEARLAEPVTPEQVDVALKNRHTTARLGWEPRFHDPFLHKWLHRVTVPVQIVWGENDRILPVPYAHAFKKLLPHAEIEIVPASGHLPQVEHADRFCDGVLRFAKGS